MGDIRDGDPDDMPTLVLGIVIGMGKDRIVVIAGVRRVDGDERHVTQVFAVAKGSGRHGVGLKDHLIGEIIGNAMLMDRDERDRLGRHRIPQPINHPSAWKPHAILGTGLFGLDQLAILRAAGCPGRHGPFFAVALVDRLDASAFCAFAKETEDLARVGPDAANETGLIVVCLSLHFLQACKDPVALSKGRIRRAVQDHNDGFRAIALPFHGARQKIAIGCLIRDCQNRDWRQFIRIAIGLFAPRQMALFLQLAQETFEIDFRRAFHAKSAGDIPFGGLRRIVRNPLQDVGFAWHLGHGRHLARRPQPDNQRKRTTLKAAAAPQPAKIAIASDIRP